MDQGMLELVKQIRNPGTRARDFLADAYIFAKEVYLGSFEDGEATLAHTAEIARVVGSWGLGALTMSAALLSKVPPNAIYTETIEERLGTHLHTLIQRLRTLSLISFDVSKAQSVRSFSTFFIATAQDLRVLIIRIAEHLVMLRKSEVLPLKEAERLAQETLKVYVPLADRLGMYETVKELENIAFAILHPRIYKKLSDSLTLQEQNQAEAMTHCFDILTVALREGGINEPFLESRTKTIYNIYKKAKKKRAGVADLYDIHAIRVIVESTKECYHALGVIHSNCSPIHGRLKDYIALPKSNGYQSLHTTVIWKDSITIEIQIRTREMHYNAQFGFAAHATYKHPEGAEMLQWFPYFFPPPSMDISSAGDEMLEHKLPQWITSLTNPTTYVSPSTEEHAQRQRKFLENYVFVFDSDGLVTKLNHPATVIDYIHTHRGLKDTTTFDIQVNDVEATPETPLTNGDIVDLLSRKSNE